MQESEEKQELSSCSSAKSTSVKSPKKSKSSQNQKNTSARSKSKKASTKSKSATGEKATDEYSNDLEEKIGETADNLFDQIDLDDCDRQSKMASNFPSKVGNQKTEKDSDPDEVYSNKRVSKRSTKGQRRKNYDFEVCL